MAEIQVVVLDLRSAASVAKTATNMTRLPKAAKVDLSTFGSRQNKIEYVVFFRASVSVLLLCVAMARQFDSTQISTDP